MVPSRPVFSIADLHKVLHGLTYSQLNYCNAPYSGIGQGSLLDLHLEQNAAANKHIKPVFASPATHLHAEGKRGDKAKQCDSEKKGELHRALVALGAASSEAALAETSQHPPSWTKHDCREQKDSFPSAESSSLECVDCIEISVKPPDDFCPPALFMLMCELMLLFIHIMNIFLKHEIL